MLGRQSCGVLPAPQHRLLDHVLGRLQIAVDDRQHEPDQPRLVSGQPGTRAIVTARNGHAHYYAAPPRGVQPAKIWMTTVTGFTATDRRAAQNVSSAPAAALGEVHGLAG